MTQYDAQLDADGDFPLASKIISGADLVLQRIRLRLQRGTGEWFIDPVNVGLPLIEWKGTKPAPVESIVARIQNEIRQIPDVVSTVNFTGTYEQSTRKVTITGDVIITNGSAVGVVLISADRPKRNTMSFGVFFSSGRIPGGFAPITSGRV